MERQTERTKRTEQQARQQAEQTASREETAAERTAAASLLDADIETLLTADPKQLAALASLVGNSAFAALLRGDTPLMSAGLWPDAVPGDRVNRVKTSPPALRSSAQGVGLKTGQPNRLGAIAPHMGAYREEGRWNTL